MTSSPLRTIYRWRERLEKENKITKRPGSGRKPKLDVTSRRVLGRIVQNDPRISNNRIANRLGELGNLKVSRFTIARELKSLNIERFRPFFNLC